MTQIDVHNHTAEGRWSVAIGAETVGAFFDEAEAIAAAQRNARRLLRGSQQVQIVVNGDSARKVTF